MADPNEDPTIEASFTPRKPKPLDPQRGGTVHGSGSALQKKVPVLTAVLGAGAAVLFGALLTATALRSSSSTPPPKQQPQPEAAAAAQKPERPPAREPIPVERPPVVVEERTPAEFEVLSEPQQKRPPSVKRDPEQRPDVPALVIRIPESARRDYERLTNLGSDLEREWRRTQKETEREWKRYGKRKDRDRKKEDKEDKEEHEYEDD